MTQPVKKYRSPEQAAIHEMMSDLHEIGLVDDQTMRQFDASCLARPGEGPRPPDKPSQPGSQK